MPAFARAALLGAVMLVPLALHQGLLGFALPFFSVGLIYGAGRQRLVLCLAAIAVLVGAFPMARLAGTLLTAYVEAPIEAAVFATDGFALPGELRLLESVAESDPMAAMALAVVSRRAGNLAEAGAQYRRLLQQEPANYAGANNAANVKLELGQLESAIDLYRRSLDMNDSATVLFNLSQVHAAGRRPREFHGRSSTAAPHALGAGPRCPVRRIVRGRASLGARVGRTRPERAALGGSICLDRNSLVGGRFSMEEFSPVQSVRQADVPPL